MKKLTITAASAAVLTIAGIGLMSSAQGAEPKARFNNMRNAVLAKAHQGKGSTYVQAGVTPEGTWILVNGQLVQPDPSGTTHIDGPDGSHIVVTTTHDLSSLPPEMRAKYEAMTKGTHGSFNSVMVQNDGGAKATAKGVRTVAAGSKALKLDLDANHYQAITFGANTNTLVLTPKGSEARRYLVNLNPKSALPVSMSLEQKASGKWTRVRESKVVI